MTDTKRLSTDVVEELYELGEDGPVNGWELIAKQRGGSRRWVEEWTMVLHELGSEEFWAIDYELGLTEYQENVLPWRPDYGDRPEELTLYRVYPRQVTRTVYSA